MAAALLCAWLRRYIPLAIPRIRKSAAFVGTFERLSPLAVGKAAKDREHNPISCLECPARPPPPPDNALLPTRDARSPPAPSRGLRDEHAPGSGSPLNYA